MRVYACTQCGHGLFLPRVVIKLDDSGRAIGPADHVAAESYECSNCGKGIRVDPQGEIESDTRSGKARSL